MARTGGVVNYNTFVQGLITEASPLTYPENATLREENFELRRDGTRARRYGIDFENSYDSSYEVLKDYTNTSALMSYEWFNAGNAENRNFLVVQVGQYLNIYEMGGTTLSTNKRTKIIDLEDFLANPTTSVFNTRTYPVSVAAIKGVLVVTSPVIEPFFIQYYADSMTFQVSQITVETRDLFGIPDETPSVDFRPTSLTAKHEYNLKNQGWTADNITATYTDLGVYPSNADIMHIAKSTTYEAGTADWEIEDIGTYKPEYLEREIFGTTPAPKGKFIYNVFNKTYEDTTDGTVTSISSISYDTNNNVITIDLTTGHGLSVGDSIVVKDIDINMSWETTDFDGESYTATRDLPPDFNTINDRTFVIKAVPTATSIKISWYLDLETSDIKEALGWRAASATLNSLDTTANSAVVIPSASIVDLNTEEKFRFKATAGYAGRAWYAGMDGGSYGSFIFFSQVLDDLRKIGQCYQEADPTSEHLSDLVDTDGGFIVIPEARNVQALVPMGQYLFVFSTNGVWRVFGDDGGNFRATAYSVEKVSDIGVNSRFSIVPVENEIYYWSVGGIYKIGQGEVSGRYSAVNISQLTIQSLFFEIGGDQHKYVKGSYDPTEKKIYWLYSTIDISATVTPFKYDECLIFDLVLNSFYQYIFPRVTDDSLPFISGIFTIPNVQVIENVRNVVSGGDQVITSGSDNVISTVYPPRSQSTQTKFLTLAESLSTSTNYFVTFSEIRDTDFLDFNSYNNSGQDAAAYMITGADTQGSQANKKQAHYLLMYFARTETSLADDGSGNIIADNPSSCKVNVLWDWATDINSVRAGSQFQAYRLNRYYVSNTSSDSYTYGEDTIVTKSKLRGRGRALSIAIQSEPGYDLYIYGWSLVMSGGRRP